MGVDNVQIRQDLECTECGTKAFLRTQILSWLPGGGVTDKPGHLVCSNCFNVIDVNRMVTRMELKQKKQEMEAIQAEVDHEEATMAQRDAETLAVPKRGPGRPRKEQTHATGT